MASDPEKKKITFSLLSTVCFLPFPRADSPHPFPLIRSEVTRLNRAGRSRAGELCRERGGGAGEGVEDQEREDGGQVQRPTQRRDDAPEDVQVRVAYRAEGRDDGGRGVGEPGEHEPDDEHGVVEAEEAVDAVGHHHPGHGAAQHRREAALAAGHRARRLPHRHHPLPPALRECGEVVVEVEERLQERVGGRRGSELVEAARERGEVRGRKRARAGGAGDGDVAYGEEEGRRVGVRRGHWMGWSGDAGETCAGSWGARSS